MPTRVIRHVFHDSGFGLWRIWWIKTLWGRREVVLIHLCARNQRQLAARGKNLKICPACKEAVDESVLMVFKLQRGFRSRR
jgi:hypothetical protein